MEGNSTGQVYNLKLCVDDRDFFVGGYKYTLTARIMEERWDLFTLVYGWSMNVVQQQNFIN